MPAKRDKFKSKSDAGASQSAIAEEDDEKLKQNTGTAESTGEWAMAYSDDGDRYWWHTTTMETTWEDPATTTRETQAEVKDTCGTDNVAGSESVPADDKFAPEAVDVRAESASRKTRLFGSFRKPRPERGTAHVEADSITSSSTVSRRSEYKIKRSKSHIAKGGAFTVSDPALIAHHTMSAADMEKLAAVEAKNFETTEKAAASEITEGAAVSTPTLVSHRKLTPGELESEIQRTAKNDTKTRRVSKHQRAASISNDVSVSEPKFVEHKSFNQIPGLHLEIMKIGPELPQQAPATSDHPDQLKPDEQTVVDGALTLCIAFPSEARAEMVSIRIEHPDTTAVHQILALACTTIPTNAFETAFRETERRVGFFVQAQNFWLDPDRPIGYYKGLKFLKKIDFLPHVDGFQVTKPAPSVADEAATYDTEAHTSGSSTVCENCKMARSDREKLLEQQLTNVMDELEDVKIENERLLRKLEGSRKNAAQLRWEIQQLRGSAKPHGKLGAPPPPPTKSKRVIDSMKSAASTPDVSMTGRLVAAQEKLAVTEKRIAELLVEKTTAETAGNVDAVNSLQKEMREHEDSADRLRMVMKKLERGSRLERKLAAQRGAGGEPSGAHQQILEPADASSPVVREGKVEARNPAGAGRMPNQTGSDRSLFDGANQVGEADSNSSEELMIQNSSLDDDTSGHGVREVVELESEIDDIFAGF